MTDCLVCVYYKVDRPALDAHIAAVRELQRALAREAPGLAAELLLRSEHSEVTRPSTSPSSDGTSARQAALSFPIPDPTLMETYRLAAPVDEASLAAFLARLDGLARPLAPRVRGDRHVEVFRPCVS